MMNCVFNLPSLAALQRLLVAVLAVSLGSTSFAGTISWDGGGDGASTFQEANWVVTDDTGSAALSGLVGSDPPANFVNGATDVEADAIVGGTATAGGGAGAGNHYDLGDGFGLTVQDDAIFRMQLGSFGGGPRGIRGVSGGSTETVTIEDNAAVFSQFFLNLSASIADAATLTFGGGGVGTLNNSTLELASDWTGTVTWNNFNIAGSTIFSNITVGGAPAVEGGNVLVLSNGGSGSILKLIPEPATASLALLSVCGLLLTRREL